MIRRIRTISRKEFIEIVRDGRSLIIILLLPVILLVIFGYAITLDIREVRLAVLDNDRSPLSREFISSLTASDYFRIVRYLSSESEIDPLLNKREIQCAVVIPQGFEKEVMRKENAEVQFLIDGIDASTAGIIQGYVNAAAMAISQEVSEGIAASKGIVSGNPLEVESRFWYNMSLETTQFFVPGLLAMILIIISVILVSISIVREKELGTIEQMRVSPVSSFQLIAGKILPYLLISLVIAASMIFMAHLLFGITVKGSFLYLFAGTVCYLLATLSLGIFIATIADSQQVAFQISMVVSQLPTVILSGFVFPIDSMPKAIQVLSNITPSKFYIVILRDILIKGAPPEAYASQLAYLLVFAFLLLMISVVRIRRAGLV